MKFVMLAAALILIPSAVIFSMCLEDIVTQRREAREREARLHREIKVLTLNQTESWRYERGEHELKRVA